MFHFVVMCGFDLKILYILDKAPISIKKTKFKKNRKLWKIAAIHNNITFGYIFSQHFQMSCLKNQHATNQIVCLNAPFTITLQEHKVKVSHAKINLIFHALKMLLQNPIITQYNLGFFA